MRLIKRDTFQVFAVFILLLNAGCSDDPPIVNDNGFIPLEIEWPKEALAVFPGASNPDLAVSSSGRIYLSVSREGRSEIILLPDETVLDLGPGEAGKAAASKDEDRVIVLFNDDEENLKYAWISEGELLHEPIIMIDDQDEWGLRRYIRDYSLYWKENAGPLAFLHSQLPELIFQGGESRQEPRADFILAAVPPPEKGSIPLPSLDMRLATGDYTRIGWGEAPTLFDLHDHPSYRRRNAMLALESQGEQGPGDTYSLRWILAAPDTDEDNGESHWFRPEERGSVRLPGTGNRTWIGIHKLGTDNGIITWHAPSVSPVYDIFMTTVVVAEDGTPEPGEKIVNISETFGPNDHSEHPVIRPYGDLFWVAWRETFFGPRVALYDKSLNRLAYISNRHEQRQKGTAVMGAAVMPDGDLLVAAEVQPENGSSEVHVWRLKLPE